MYNTDMMHTLKFKPKFELNDKIRNNLQEIERLRDIISDSKIQPEIEASIRVRASVEAVHSSTSIEGNPLDINQVRAVVTSEKVLSREEYAELEVRNYKKALDYIEKRRLDNRALDMSDILELHRIITDELLNKTRNGKLRLNPVFIENEKNEVLYEAADFKKVRDELEALLVWVDENRFNLHPVIIAGVIHLRFVAIHPFADGNGRTARALVSLFLALSNYDCNGSLVLDSYYASDRRGYYAVLSLVNGANFASSTKADLTPWLKYFTDGFLTSLHVLDAEIRMLSLSLADVKVSELTRDEEDLLAYVTKFGSISVSTAEKILPNLDRRTIQRRLHSLVDKGYLALEGSTRDAKYVR